MEWWNKNKINDGNNIINDNDFDEENEKKNKVDISVVSKKNDENDVEVEENEDVVSGEDENQLTQELSQKENNNNNNETKIVENDNNNHDNQVDFQDENNENEDMDLNEDRAIEHKKSEIKKNKNSKKNKKNEKNEKNDFKNNILSDLNKSSAEEIENYVEKVDTLITSSLYSDTESFSLENKKLVVVGYDQQTTQLLINLIEKHGGTVIYFSTSNRNSSHSFHNDLDIYEYSDYLIIPYQEGSIFKKFLKLNKFIASG